MKPFKIAAILAGICMTVGMLRADDPPEAEIKIVKAAVDKNAGWVSVPGAFWNMMQASWI